MSIRVAVGVVLDKGRVFIALRPKNKHKGGFWEFPGGKIEPSETILDALTRELKEEIDIQVKDANPLTQIKWSYAEKDVILEVMIVSEFTGEPRGIEGQKTRWVAISDLKDYHFPEANESIVKLLMKGL